MRRSATPRIFASTAANSLRRRAHLIEIIAIDGNRHLAARPAEQLVEPHLNRLGHIVEIADDRLRDLLDPLLHVLFCANTGRPLVFRFQHHVIVGVIGRHRVKDQIGRSRLREHKIDLGKREQGALDLEIDVL